MRYVHSLKHDPNTGLNIFHGLSTNGVLLDHSKIQTLADLDVIVAVSLDGLSAENDKISLLKRKGNILDSRAKY